MEQDKDEQIKLLTEKLAMYEAAANAQQTEHEEKRRVRKIFDSFDEDKSGTIDWEEFQALSFKLGQVLTDEEAKRCVDEIDTDKNGSVSFDEFFEWWKSPKENLGNAGDNLRVLKFKLTSKNFINDFAHVTSKLAQSQKERKDKESNLISVGGTVSVGHMEECRSSIKLAHTVSAEAATKYREDAKASESSIILALSFTVTEGIDPFELGEISGSIKNILSMGKGKLKYESFESKVKKVEGINNLVYTLLFAVDPKVAKPLQNVLEVVDALQLKELEAKVELSQRPGDVPAEEKAVEYLNAKTTVRIAADRASLKSLVSDISRHNKEKTILANAFLAIKDLSFNLELASLEELQTKFPWPSSIPKYEGFASARSSLALRFGALLLDDAIPQPLKTTYDQVATKMEGLHSVAVVLGDHVVELTAHNMNIGKGYLPTLEQLKQAFERD
ncbi:Calcineurin subunit B [Balamuthia mandrillaris]